jgi:hypothetical protein
MPIMKISPTTPASDEIWVIHPDADDGCAAAGADVSREAAACGVPKGLKRSLLRFASADSSLGAGDCVSAFTSGFASGFTSAFTSGFTSGFASAFRSGWTAADWGREIAAEVSAGGVTDSRDGASRAGDSLEGASGIGGPEPASATAAKSASAATQDASSW